MGLPLLHKHFQRYNPFIFNTLIPISVIYFVKRHKNEIYIHTQEYIYILIKATLSFGWFITREGHSSTTLHICQQHYFSAPDCTFDYTFSLPLLTLLFRRIQVTCQVERIFFVDGQQMIHNLLGFMLWIKKASKPSKLNKKQGSNETFGTSSKSNASMQRSELSYCQKTAALTPGCWG